MRSWSSSLVLKPMLEAWYCLSVLQLPKDSIQSVDSTWWVSLTTYWLSLRGYCRSSGLPCVGFFWCNLSFWLVEPEWCLLEGCVRASLGLLLCVACVLTSLSLRVACVLALLGYRPGRGPTTGVWQRHWYRLSWSFAWRGVLVLLVVACAGFFKRLQATYHPLQASCDRRVCDQLAYTSLEPSTLHFSALLCTSLHF